MIELQDITFRYPEGREVFAHFSWQIGERQAWSVLGPSGCGKSTLLTLLAGLRLPTDGHILVAGEALTRPRPKTGLILQDFGLLPWATVRQNVALGFRIRGFYGPDGTHAPKENSDGLERQAVEPWLERLGLGSVADSFPGQISGGQRRARRHRPHIGAPSGPAPDG